MDEKKYIRDGVDVKRLFLLFARKCWLVVAGLVFGAVLGALVYQMIAAVQTQGKKYRVSADYYITFNFEQFENSTDYYNAYTWDNLLRDDPIVDEVLRVLPDSYTKEEVKGAVKGEMLGDYRILTVSVTTDSVEKAEEIAKAYETGLSKFAQDIDMLTKIEQFSLEQPVLINEYTRTKNAAFLGALILAFGTIFYLWLLYLLDDSIYVESDFVRQYNIPFLGVLTNQKDAKLLQQLKDNFCYICDQDKSYYAVNISTSDTMENPCVPTLSKECPAIKKQLHLKGDNFRTIRESGGVILLVPYGKTNGKILKSIILNLEKQDCPIAGAILTDADDRFLKWYYLGKKA